MGSGKRDSKKEKIAQAKMYVDDLPILSLSQDRFQFSQVAQLLYQVLQTANLPMHIGLFGPWGTGKTSVLKLLEETITANDKTFEMKIISVWKFADDAPSLHRKIVREIESVLDKKDDEGLNQETIFSAGAVGEGLGLLFITLFNPKKWNKSNRLLRWLGAAYLSSFAVAEFILNYLTAHHPKVISWITSQSVLVAIYTAISIAFSKSNLQRSEQISVKQLGLQHGDQYEYRFERAVKSYLDGKDGLKLILVFDDLDRLPPKQLVAALNTISTFLYSKRCAFIIPCDEAILREGIRIVYSNQGVKELSVSDYLNKTFDYQVHLPTVEPINMRRYAKELLKSQNISWASSPKMPVDRILGLLIHSGVKTPRQVKTLLNAFASDWSLAFQRDTDAGLTFLTQNPSIIAIFTVLKTSFSTYYSQVEASPYTLLNDVFTLKNADRDEQAFVELQNTLQEVGGDDLAAFLSRIAREVPDDPRHFVYFSNNKLNPIAGRPLLEKTKEYMVDARNQEFVESFSQLEEDEKRSLFEVILTDIDDGSEIEVKNCLRTLIETEIALPYRAESDFLRWDDLLQGNMDVLNEFAPSLVTETLVHLAFSDETWGKYGETIDIEMYKDDLISLWQDKPSAVDKMSINNLGDRLRDVYKQTGEVYQLPAVLFNLGFAHPMLERFDWLELLHDAVNSDVIPEFTFADWLLTWSDKTITALSCDVINSLMQLYDFKNEKPLMGIGVLWIKAYKGDFEPLEKLLSLMNSTSFVGFESSDLQELNSILAAQKDYAITSKKVRELLDGLWEQGEQERVCELISFWPKSPGVPGFCSTKLDLEFPAERLNLFVDVIVKRASNLTAHTDTLMEKLRAETNAAINQGRSSRALTVYAKLADSDTWAKAVTKDLSAWLPLNDVYAWLNWAEPVVHDQLQLCSLYFQTDEDVHSWLLNCVGSLVAVSQNAVNSGRGFNANAGKYLNLIIGALVQKFKLKNWDEIVEMWSKISVPNRSDVSLLQDLDVPTLDIVLEELTRHCSLSNDVLNEWLVAHHNFDNPSHCIALNQRAGYIGSHGRLMTFASLSKQPTEFQQDFVSKLAQEFKRHPKANYLTEMSAWNIDPVYKEQLCFGIIDGFSTTELEDWIDDSMRNMNENGVEYWTVVGLERVVAERSGIQFKDYSVLETALGLSDKRAELALKLILQASNLGYTQLKFMKDKIFRYKDSHIELVKQIQKKFSIRPSRQRAKPGKS